ncbi:MAG: 16S rRNA (uracil(1498)-N(3))-methyltransferase [Candidatus Coatesbacteria bacterium]|nr:16S rRNA (uracil(1498)-N(3))-methyltransferase [Candidatus Coatesbacteria bacterium]
MQRNDLPHLFLSEKTGNIVYLNENETKHIRVLRLRNNDLIFCIDGKGYKYLVRILETGKSYTRGEIIEEHFAKSSSRMLTLGFSPPSLNRTTWLIEKSIEIGIDFFQPIFFERSLTRNFPSLEKYESKMRECLKQCRRAYMPVILPVKKFHHFFPVGYDYILFASIHGEKLPEIEGNNILLLVGPEGDFTDKELQQINDFPNSFAVKLSENRLRLETACISLLSNVKAQFA